MDNWVSRTPSSISKDDLDSEIGDFDSAVEHHLQQRYTSPSPTPPSPPNSFEKLFLPFELTTPESSAIYNPFTFSPTTPSIPPSESILTEDFASAIDDISETTSVDDSNTDFNTNTNTNLSIDEELGVSSAPQAIEPVIDEGNTTTNNDTTTNTNTDTNNDTTTDEINNNSHKNMSTETEETTPTPKFDVVENVYEGAKSVWAFGKGIIVFKPFMGVAEDAAAKVLSITAGVSSLEDADKHIKSTLAGVDVEFIDPAILKLWSVIEPIVGKGDDVLKMMLGLVSKKVPMIEEEPTTEEDIVVESEPGKMLVSEEATAPETSTPAVAL